MDTPVSSENDTLHAPREFIDAVKRLLPNRTTLHQVLESGDVRNIDREFYKAANWEHDGLHLVAMLKEGKHAELLVELLPLKYGILLQHRWWSRDFSPLPF